MKIIYDAATKDLAIKSLGLKKGAEGYLVNASTNEQIVDDDQEPIKYKQFAGIKKGSIHYYKSDLLSIIALSKHIQVK